MVVALSGILWIAPPVSAMVKASNASSA